MQTHQKTVFICKAVHESKVDLSFVFKYSHGNRAVVSRDQRTVPYVRVEYQSPKERK